MCTCLIIEFFLDFLFHVKISFLAFLFRSLCYFQLLVHVLFHFWRHSLIESLWWNIRWDFIFCTFQILTTWLGQSPLEVSKMTEDLIFKFPHHIFLALFNYFKICSFRKEAYRSFQKIYLSDR